MKMYRRIFLEEASSKDNSRVVLREETPKENPGRIILEGFFSEKNCGPRRPFFRGPARGGWVVASGGGPRSQGNPVPQGGGAFGCIPGRFLDGTVSQEMSKNVVRQGGGGSEATRGRGIRAAFGPRGIWCHFHTCTGFRGCLQRHVMASGL